MNVRLDFQTCYLPFFVQPVVPLRLNVEKGTLPSKGKRLLLESEEFEDEGMTVITSDDAIPVIR